MRQGPKRRARDLRSIFAFDQQPRLKWRASLRKTTQRNSRFVQSTQTNKHRRIWSQRVWFWENPIHKTAFSQPTSNQKQACDLTSCVAHSSSSSMSSFVRSKAVYSCNCQLYLFYVSHACLFTIVNEIVDEVSMDAESTCRLRAYTSQTDLGLSEIY